MRLVEKVPGEGGRICVFETRVGERFSVVEPKMSKEQKAALIDVLREILKEEGGLNEGGARGRIVSNRQE